MQIEVLWLEAALLIQADERFVGYRAKEGEIIRHEHGEVYRGQFLHI